VKTMKAPLLAVAAFSGTGKTTLLKKLIPTLRDKGIRCGLIKHTHHDMEIDKTGKDSYELRKAGADQVLVASRQRWALMTETPSQSEPDLAYLASRMNRDALDLILIEGFKDEPIAKIMLHRDAAGKPFPKMLDKYVIALASDKACELNVPCLALDDVEGIAEFIEEWLKTQES